MKKLTKVLLVVLFITIGAIGTFFIMLNDAFGDRSIDNFIGRVSDVFTGGFTSGVHPGKPCIGKKKINGHVCAWKIDRDKSRSFASYSHRPGLRGEEHITYWCDPAQDKCVLPLEIGQECHGHDWQCGGLGRCHKGKCQSRRTKEQIGSNGNLKKLYNIK
jgi:hypothetical protein